MASGGPRGSGLQWCRPSVYARGHFQRSRYQNLVVCVYGAGGVQLRLNAVLVSSGLQVGRETPRGDKTASTESEHKMRSLCWRPELDLFVRRRENALLRCVLDGRGEVAFEGRLWVPTGCWAPGVVLTLMSLLS